MCGACCTSAAGRLHARLCLPGSLPSSHQPARPTILPTTRRDRARAPTVLLLNSDEPQALRHALPALADLPTAAMPLAAPTSALPALGWQLPASRSAVQQLLAAGEWLRARVAAAQYAHLPLAAIGGDWILDAADALYARQLREWALGVGVGVVLPAGGGGGEGGWQTASGGPTRSLCFPLQARRGTCCGRPTPPSPTWTASRWAVLWLGLWAGAVAPRMRLRSRCRRPVHISTTGCCASVPAPLWNADPKPRECGSCRRWTEPRR